MSVEDDIQELKEMMAALKQENTSLKTRLSEVEDFAQTHIGMDWGTAGTSANTPHPILSIDTGEFGGGIMRLDLNGIQVLADGAEVTALYFVDVLRPSVDNTVANGYVWGRVDNPSSVAPDWSVAQLRVGSFAVNNTFTSSGSGYVETQSHEAGGVIVAFSASLVSSFSPGGYGGYLRSYTTAAGITQNYSYGSRFEIQSNSADNAPLYLNGTDNDPDTLLDGMIWYRTDLDTFRARINGATVTIAPISASILTDPAWAAAGDLVYGTGNDTATILSHPGSAGLVLTSTTAPNAMTWATPAGGSFSYGKAITTSQGQNLP